MIMWPELLKKAKKEGEVLLRVKVNPGSDLTEFKGKREDGVYKMNVAAPPEKDKANKELVRFLAEGLGVDKNNVTIVSGHRGKDKKIKIVI